MEKEILALPPASRDASESVWWHMIAFFKISLRVLILEAEEENAQ